MKQSIEKAMAELNMGREELSSALGMSRPYITKMLTRPQSEKTQAKVVGMIDGLMQSGGVKQAPIASFDESELLDAISSDKDKTIKDLNQALEYKDQLLAKNEDDFQKKSKELRECKCDILELSKTVAGYQNENSDLSLVISVQQKSIVDKAGELLEIKLLNSDLSNQLEILNRKNKEINTCYAIVCVILTALVVWGFYV